MTIAINNFVLRQTKDSKYGHFNGGWDKLCDLVEKHFSEAKQGYRDGVLSVPVHPEGFFSSVVPITQETKLIASYEARRAGEQAYIQVTAQGAKVPAKKVEVILYRHDVLAEGKENSTDADWEVISLNCYPDDSGDVMSPMARARNILGMAGGTDAKLQDKSKEELIALIQQMAREQVYWGTHVQVS